MNDQISNILAGAETSKVTELAGPLQHTIMRGFNQINKLTSHRCSEKQFQPTFIADSKKLSAAVLKTLSVIG